MSEIVIPFHDVILDPSNIEEEVWKILPLVRATWIRDNVIVKKFDKGYVNRMCFCQLTNDPNQEDAIIVRVHQGMLSSWFGNKTLEVAALTLGHRAGCTGAVHAIFTNGIVIQYLHGRTLSYKDLHDPHIIRLTTKALARLHTIDVDAVNIRDTRGHRYEIPHGVKMFDRMRDTLTKTPEECFLREGLPNRNELLLSLNEAQVYLESLCLPVVFCHFDCRSDNILYNPISDTVKMIDLEGATLAYAPQDFTMNFWDKESWVEFGWCKADDPDFKDSTIRLWAEDYLRAIKEVRGQSPDDVTEDDVNNFYQLLVTEFRTFCHLTQTVICLQFGEDIVPLSVLQRTWRNFCAERSNLRQKSS